MLAIADFYLYCHSTRSWDTLLCKCCEWTYIVLTNLMEWIHSSRELSERQRVEVFKKMDVDNSGYGFILSKKTLNKQKSLNFVKKSAASRPQKHKQTPKTVKKYCWIPHLDYSEFMQFLQLRDVLAPSVQGNSYTANPVRKYISLTHSCYRCRSNTPVTQWIRCKTVKLAPPPPPNKKWSSSNSSCLHKTKPPPVTKLFN